MIALMILLMAWVLFVLALAAHQNANRGTIEAPEYVPVRRVPAKHTPVTYTLRAGIK